jgi:anti-sigma-K factor RskA
VDTREYIESGILEAYILGALTKEEQAEVEAYVARYPELRDELRNIEATMLQYATLHAVTPPNALQDKIWNSLRESSPNAGNIETKAPPMRKTIPFTPERRKPMQWQYAAALATLFGSIVLNIILYNQSKKEREEKYVLAAEMTILKDQQKQLADVLGEYQKAKVMMADTGMQTIVMHTMQPGHPMAATLYWSKTKGDAYVAMNALPQPPQGMQYQLWVIQNGKPVSMGVLPNDMANTPAMQKVAMQVTNGEAFAISLEKEGGNPIPTTVYVLGKA